MPQSVLHTIISHLSSDRVFVYNSKAGTMKINGEVLGRVLSCGGSLNSSTYFFQLLLSFFLLAASRLSSLSVNSLSLLETNRFSSFLWSISFSLLSSFLFYLSVSVSLLYLSVESSLSMFLFSFLSLLSLSVASELAFLLLIFLFYSTNWLYYTARRHHAACYARLSHNTFQACA